MIRNFQDNERNIFDEFSSAKQRPGEKFKDFVHRLLNTVEKIIQAGIEIEAKGTETSGLMEISEENEEVCAVSAQKKVCFSCNKKGHLA